MQELFEAGLVQNFDADVAVQRSCYQACDEVEDVTSDQRTAHGHALVGWVDHILALEAVHVDAKEDVDAKDEGFSDQQGFPEVEGAAHLGHEFAVDLYSEGFKSADCLRHYIASWSGFKARASRPAAERLVRSLNSDRAIGLYPSVTYHCSAVGEDGLHEA